MKPEELGGGDLTLLQFKQKCNHTPFKANYSSIQLFSVSMPEFLCA